MRGRAALEQWVLACAAGVIYYVLAWAGRRFALGAENAAPVWPAGGFALAAVLLWGPSAAIGVFLGACLAHERPALAGGASTFAVLAAPALAGAGGAAQALIGAWALRRWGMPEDIPRSAREAAVFCALAPLIAAISPGFELLALAQGGPPPGADWAHAALIWWIGNTAGVLVVVPLLLAWSRPRARRASPAPAPDASVPRRTERRRAFEAAPEMRSPPPPPPREAAPLLRLLIDSARDYAIFQLDAQGRVATWSRGAELIYGWAEKEIIGSPYRRLLLPEHEIEGDIKAEGWCPRKDGSTFWAEITLTAMRREDGAYLGHAAIVRDAGLRRKNELALSARSAALARSNAELAQFAYIASHDLNAPLHKVKAFGDRLRQKLEGALDDEGRDYMHRMMRAVDGMQQLIDGLLALSRVTTRGGPAEVVDLGALAKDVAEGLEAAGARGTARVEIGPLPRINADPLQMRQLLQNLVSNALKFQPPGARPHVRVRGKATGDGLCELVVSDNGIGIDMKFAERIFQPFQRLNSAFEYQGSGIGLAICRKIATRHGGTITVTSEPGHGAEFKVVMPISQEGRMECQPLEQASR